MNHTLKKISKELKSRGADERLWASRAQSIRDAANPVQRNFILDKSKRKSLRCPRRSGKSFSFTSHALEYGEDNPGSRILIISLTIKSTKENYWTSAPGGLFEQSKTHGLNLDFNKTELTWTHENGSRGRLAGAETRADIEYFRGAAAEADLIIIDECKSFAPDLLFELIRDVINPGLMTRSGTLVMGGTPGSIPQGVFYEATSPLARNDADEPTCIQYKGESLSEDDYTWSLHSWTIQDNIAKPHQWKNALRFKKAAGWDDNNPIWRREYLGEWTTDISELVYSYANVKAVGKGTWLPDLKKDSKTGLDPTEGPWNLIMGVDLGVIDDCAIVVSAWSDTIQELRQVHCWKSPHLDVSMLAAEIIATIERFGKPNVIVADMGALGLMIVNEINNRYGLSIVPAEKREKNDHIELLNADINAGRIKLIKNSELDDEMCGLQWKLDRIEARDEKGGMSMKNKVLIRSGKLKEDSSCPNHLCDAFLYSWRYSYHYWAQPAIIPIDKGSQKYWEEREKESIERMVNKTEHKEKVDTFSTRFREIKDNDTRFRRRIS